MTKLSWNERREKNYFQSGERHQCAFLKLGASRVNSFQNLPARPFDTKRVAKFCPGPPECHRGNEARRRDRAQTPGRHFRCELEPLFSCFQPTAGSRSAVFCCCRPSASTFHQTLFPPLRPEPVSQLLFWHRESCFPFREE